MSQDQNAQYQVFLSYSRLDDTPLGNSGIGFIKLFGKALAEIYEKNTNRKLNIFYDQDEIENQVDWQVKLLEGIHSSQLFIAFLSPNYLRSEVCKWEWREYLNKEHFLIRGDSGMTYVYCIEIPGIPNSRYDSETDPERLLSDPEIKRFLDEQKKTIEHKQIYADIGLGEERAFFDFRPLLATGLDRLLELDAITRVDDLRVDRNGLVGGSALQKMHGISDHIIERLDRFLLGSLISGNIYNPDSKFSGRYEELKDIHQSLIVEGNTILAINGFGGMGKTALAKQYAHAYSEYYVAGGRWLIDCEGHKNIYSALRTFFQDKREFFRNELSSLNLPGENVKEEEGLRHILGGLLRICRSRVDSVQKEYNIHPERLNKVQGSELHARIIIILDNVTEETFLTANEINQLPLEGWLKVIVTSRLKKTEIAGTTQNHLKILELSNIDLEESISIYRQYQNRNAAQNMFNDTDYAKGVSDLAIFLDGYTHAIVLSAAYLGSQTTVRASEYLEKLKLDSLKHLDEVATSDKVVMRSTDNLSQKKTIYSILAFVVERLNSYERRALRYASLMSNEYVSREWIDIMLIEDFPEHTKHKIGEPDLLAEAWLNLDGYRLLTETERKSDGTDRAYYKMHITISEFIREQFIEEADKKMLLNRFYERFYNSDHHNIIDRKDLLTSEDLKNTIELLGQFSRSNLIERSQLRRWIMFGTYLRSRMGDFEAIECFNHIRTNALNNFQIIDQQLIGYLNSIDRQNTDAVKNIYLTQYKLFFSSLLYKRFYGRSSLYILEISAQQITFEEGVDDFEALIEMLEFLLKEFLSLKTINDESDPDNLEQDLEIGSFIPDVLFDVYYTKIIQANFFSYYQKFKQAIDILSTVINDLTDFFTKRDKDKLDTRPLYNLLLDAKNAKQVFERVLRGTDEAILVNDITEQIEEASFTERYISKLSAYDKHFSIADVYHSSGDFENASIFYSKALRNLNNAYEGNELSESRFATLRIITQTKLSDCSFKIGQMSLAEYEKQIINSVVELTQGISGKGWGDMLSISFPMYILSSILTLINADGIRDAKALLYILAEFEQTVRVLFKLHEGRYTEYATFFVSYATVLLYLDEPRKNVIELLTSIWEEISVEVKFSLELPFAHVSAFSHFACFLALLNYEQKNFDQFEKYYEQSQLFIPYFLESDVSSVSQKMKVNFFLSQILTLGDKHNDLISKDLLSPPVDRSDNEVESNNINKKDLPFWKKWFKKK